MVSLDKVEIDIIISALILEHHVSKKKAEIQILIKKLQSEAIKLG